MSQRRSVAELPRACVFGLCAGLTALAPGCATDDDARKPAPTAPVAEPAPARAVPATPPVARQVEKILEAHGHPRKDPYFWLRDDERDDPEVLAYLRAENEWTEAVLDPTKALQKQLFDEIVGRLKPDDAAVPVFVDGYWHYSRFEAGKEHPIYCRKRESLEAAEEVLLDANARAEGHAYYRAASVETTRKGDVLAWAEDTVSRRIYTIHLKNLESGDAIDGPIEGTSGDLAWSDAGTHLFYVKREAGTLREYQVWRHMLGTAVSDDVMVYEEPDATYSLGVYRTKSNRFMMVHIGSTLTDEVRYVDAAKPEGALQVFRPRERGHEYSVDHAGEFFYVRSNREAKNFRLLKVKPGATSDIKKWKEVVGERKDALLESVEVFKDWLVVRHRQDANTKLRVIPLAAPNNAYDVGFSEPAFTTWIDDNPAYDTQVLRFGYSSLTTPASIFDFDMATQARELKKREPVLGGFDPNNYVTDRLEIRARDGELIPVSLVHRQDLDLTRPNPLYIYGYGSYGSSMSAWFVSHRLSLLDRGFVYAIAHIRGGSERGRRWYEDGKLLNKMNTFTDFIDVTSGLQAQGWSTPALTVAAGGSAGGLLMGAVANMAPERYEAIVSSVPFVDVVTTMLDETIPLTTFEYDEWGNPGADQEAYEYMLSYSPYDNVQRQSYPHMLVFTGLHDSQVQYWEPAKWVAKLRAKKTDDHRLLLRTNMEAGHGGAAGRFKQYEDRAVEYAFLLDVLGRAERGAARTPQAGAPTSPGTSGR